MRVLADQQDSAVSAAVAGDIASDWSGVEIASPAVARGRAGYSIEGALRTKPGQPCRSMLGQLPHRTSARENLLATANKNDKASLQLS